MRVWIGAGGWAYVNTRRDKLATYARIFEFIEVNSTFYIIPGAKVVESWRRRVSTSFRFSVRCHRDLTHRFKLAPTEQALDLLGKMEKICTTLDASILHIQTPSWLTPESLRPQDIHDLLGSTKQKIAWEMRSGRPDHRVTTLMRDLNIIHCTDLSLYPPAYYSDTVYSRLFGVSHQGKAYRFKEEELTSINQRVRESNAKQSFLTFHSLQMYEDAYVMQIFHQEGKVPSELKPELSIPVCRPFSILD